MILAGCHSPQSPYLRDVRPSFDCVEVAGGMNTELVCKPLPGYATLSVPYLRHMLKDLDACYAEDK